MLSHPALLGRRLMASSGEAHGGERRICHDADMVWSRRLEAGSRQTWLLSYSEGALGGS
jgi:hypothetical protein